MVMIQLNVPSSIQMSSAPETLSLPLGWSPLLPRVPGQDYQEKSADHLESTRGILLRRRTGGTGEKMEYVIPTQRPPSPHSHLADNPIPFE